MFYNTFGNFPSPGVGSSYDYLNYQRAQQQPNAPYPNQNSQTNITFVNGIEGAKAFQLSPNSSVLLMDSDNSKFYVKTTDSLGVAKISSYSFAEDIVSPTPGNNTAEMIQASQSPNQNDYEELRGRVSSLEQSLQSLAKSLGENIS